MAAPFVSSHTALHLKGTEAPEVRAYWQADGAMSVLFNPSAMQSISFYGTPQEIRVALAKGLAAVDRAVKEREAAERAELATADALEEPAETTR